MECSFPYRDGFPSRAYIKQCSGSCHANIHLWSDRCRSASVHQTISVSKAGWPSRSALAKVLPSPVRSDSAHLDDLWDPTPPRVNCAQAYTPPSLAAGHGMMHSAFQDGHHAGRETPNLLFPTRLVPAIKRSTFITISVMNLPYKHFTWHQYYQMFEGPFLSSISVVDSTG